MSDRNPSKRPKPREIVATPAKDSVTPPLPAGVQEEVDGIVDKGDTSNRVDLGIVALDVPPGWRFYPLDDRIIGRPGSNVGGMHIAIRPIDSLPQRPTHEMLMSVARASCNYPLNGPGFDPAKERIEGHPAGGESFRSGRDFVRVWYHLQPEGLVVAWFAVKAKRMIERAVKQLVHQSDKIIASIRLPGQRHA